MMCKGRSKFVKVMESLLLRCIRRNKTLSTSELFVWRFRAVINDVRARPGIFPKFLQIYILFLRPIINFPRRLVTREETVAYSVDLTQNIDVDVREVLLRRVIAAAIISATSFQLVKLTG